MENFNKDVLGENVEVFEGMREGGGEDESTVRKITNLVKKKKIHKKSEIF